MLLVSGWKKHFEGKKITVMGLGLLGRAVGDAQFLAQNGADLIVTDLKGDDELRASLKVLEPYPNVKYRLGGHDKADFTGRDYVLKGAGVPFDSPYTQEAEKNGIPVKMSASWFATLSKIPVVGVTGTRGKSTVTHMLYGIMKKAGMNVLLGGNIRGVSTLALLPKVAADSIALMELDSWQCRGFGDEQISPEIAVFTTFFSDHLNFYKGDMRAYLDDKAQIFLNQRPEDTLVASEQALQYIEVYKRRIRSHFVLARPRDLALSVPGDHNRLNAALAQGAARAVGVDDTVTEGALTEFKGVPGRLELIREVRGIKIYNDTTATTPEATLAALSALASPLKPRPSNLILIMGGADKGLSMGTLIEEAKKSAEKIILLSGTGTDMIKDSLPQAPVYEGLSLAVEDAVGSAKKGDVILFSPAFASFGMFKNEFDRGDQFVSLVEKL